MLRIRGQDGPWTIPVCVKTSGFRQAYCWILRPKDVFGCLGWLCSRWVKLCRNRTLYAVR